MFRRAELLWTLFLQNRFCKRVVLFLLFDFIFIIWADVDQNQRLNFDSLRKTFDEYFSEFLGVHNSPVDGAIMNTRLFFVCVHDNVVIGVILNK